MALDFPSNPVEGQVYGNFYWDSSMSAWRATGTLVPTVPSGVISQFAGTTAPPGYLMCLGQSVLVADNQALFNVIGYTYGGSGLSFNVPNLQGKIPVGKNGATFSTLGGTGGVEDVTLTSAQIPSHTHPNTLSSNTVASSTHRHDYTFAMGDSNWSPAGQAGGMGFGTGKSGAYRYSTGAYQGSTSNGSYTDMVNTNVAGGSYTSVGVGRYSTTGDTNTPSGTTTVAITNASNTGGDGSHTNLQPYIVVNYIIKT